MTTEDRFIVDLGDILNVRIECGTCGASISVNPKKWGNLAVACPSCQKNWHLGNGEKPYQAVDALRIALASIIALQEAKQLSYSVRLEVERPKG